MNNRKFKIVEDSYWTDTDQPHGGWEFKYYKVYEEIPYAEDLEVHTNGSCHDLEEAYHGILTHLGIDLEVVYND